MESRDAGFPAAAENIPQPEWDRGWAGGRLKFVSMVGFGAIATIVGIAMIREEPIPGVGVAAMGLALLLASPGFRPGGKKRPPRTGPIDERDGAPGLIFEYTRLGQLGTPAVLLLMTCTSFAIGVSPDSFADSAAEEAGLRFFGFGAAALLGSIGLLALRRVRQRPYVALLPDGIVVRNAAATSFVPWTAVSAVKAYDVRVGAGLFRPREPYIGVVAKDPAAIDRSRVTRALQGSGHRAAGVDVEMATRYLSVDPEVLYRTMHHYLQHPDERDELSGSYVARGRGPRG